MITEHDRQKLDRTDPVNTGMFQPKTKRIRLTIEWDGGCGEHDWIEQCSMMIEKGDISRVTKVIKAEALTDFGTTEPISCPDRVPFRKHIVGVCKAKAYSNPWLFFGYRAISRLFLGRRVLQ